MGIPCSWRSIGAVQVTLIGEVHMKLSEPNNPFNADSLRSWLQKPPEAFILAVTDELRQSVINAENWAKVIQDAPETERIILSNAAGRDIREVCDIIMNNADAATAVLNLMLAYGKELEKRRKF